MSMAKGQATRGDIRLDRRRDAIMTGIVTRHSLVEHKVGGGRAGEIAMLNYLASPKFGVADIVAPDVALVAKAAPALWHGRWRVWAAGPAITNPQDPKPWPTDGDVSKLCSQVALSLKAFNMVESRSP